MDREQRLGERESHRALQELGKKLTERFLEVARQEKPNIPVASHEPFLEAAREVMELFLAEKGIPWEGWNEQWRTGSGVRPTVASAVIILEGNFPNEDMIETAAAFAVSALRTALPQPPKK